METALVVWQPEKPPHEARHGGWRPKHEQDRKIEWLAYTPGIVMALCLLAYLLTVI